MEAKKSLLEKIGLVEKVQPKNNSVKEVSSEKKETDSKKVINIQKKEDQFNTDSLLKVDEIYTKYNLPGDGTNTVFIIDNFLKALPDYLPEEVKKQSVLSIISSSGMSVDNLLKDGNHRLKLLKSFLEDFSNHTNNAISQNEMEIRKLTEKIQKCKRDIENKRKLIDGQKATIEYETQKIVKIIDFIDSKK